MTVSRDVTGWMDSLACRVLRAMASKGLQGTQVSLAHLEPRASQEKWVLQDRAYPARKANVVSLETPDCLDLQASRVLQVSQEHRVRQIVTRV